MSHLLESVVCAHCGERMKIEEKKNKDGDVVRRGVCPITSITSVDNLTATPWEMALRNRPK